MSDSVLTEPTNILLIDDDERNLDVLEAVLDAPGYNLVRAAGADRALMLLINGDFAVIVLDIQMPQMSGIELAALIKQRKRTQHIPIIFLTAYYQEDDQVLAGYGTGAVDYLMKPINPQILRSKIAVFVDLYRKNNALLAANRALESEITQRQLAEKALLAANSELDARVQARTRDLLRINDELLEREKALSAREAQLRFVTDHAPVFIVQLDRGHRFKFVNRTYARRFRQSPDEMIGKHLLQFIDEASYNTSRQHIESALEGNREEYELEVAYAVLGQRWIHVVLEPEKTSKGDVVGVLAVINDITERKNVEREIAHARDKALAASRAKDAFLARLSHELRTPLSPVLLLATEAARNASLPEAMRADFEVIAQNVALEAHLIDDLLDLTGIMYGKITVQLRPLDVHSVLHDAIAMVRSDVAQKSLVLKCRTLAAEHIIRGDPVRLKQIFWNVLKNAVKFTPPGGSIEVETLASGDSLEVHIADSGIGLTEDEIANIFVAFAQGDHARGETSSEFGGLGLGLAIARMLVEQHSGTITATSAGRNKGSTFHLQLPLHRTNELVAASKPPVTQGTYAAAGPNGTGDAHRILLVEDHAPTRQTLTYLLRRRKYEVASVANIAAARELAATQSFEVLISDIGLPDGNGCELMAEFRARFGISGIALTGYGMDEDVRRSEEAGFAAHLTKPVSIEAMDRALSLVFRKNPALTRDTATTTTSP
ncbi:MAG: response regulator [Nibricoccus sp.]